MITQLQDMPNNIVAFDATGKVSADDYKNIVIPAVKQVVARINELNYLMIINTDLSEFTAGAWLQDLVVGIQEFTKWNRAAILTDSSTLNAFTDVFSVVVPGEFKGFTKDELEKAVQWVSTGII